MPANHQDQHDQSAGDHDSRSEQAKRPKGMRSNPLRTINLQLREVNDKLDHLNKAFNGDYRNPGVFTKLMMLEQFKAGATKHFWALYSAVIGGMVTFVVAVAIYLITGHKP